MTLKPRDRKPPDLGPKVRVESVHLRPSGDDAGLKALVNGVGLRDWDKDGLLEQSTEAETMWVGACDAGRAIEFELPEPVPLGALEVWNFNGEWQTTNGLRRADLAVSPDGATWQTVLKGAEFAEAEGEPDYDQPTVLKLNNVTARKVRFENLVAWNAGGKVGLSKVVFHQAAGALAAPRQPEDGAVGVALSKTVLEWVPGKDATEHRVYFGTSPDQLTILGTAKAARLDAPELKASSTCFWRVDEVQADGRVVSGRVARFETAGLAGWWKLDEAEGTTAQDASGHQLTGRVQGEPHWMPSEGKLGGAFNFDGGRNLIDCGNSPAFNFRDSLTVAVWIKVRCFDKPGQVIVAKGYGSWRLQRYQETDRVAMICTGLKATGGLEPVVSSVRSVNDGKWHHVAGIYDGAKLALYLDGQLEASAPATGRVNVTDAPVLIGADSSRRTYRWNGWMDDVRVYGCALSEAEVQGLFRAAPESMRASR